MRILEKKGMKSGSMLMWLALGLTLIMLNPTSFAVAQEPVEEKAGR